MKRGRKPEGETNLEVTVSFAITLDTRQKLRVLAAKKDLPMSKYLRQTVLKIIEEEN